MTRCINVRSISRLAGGCGNLHQWWWLWLSAVTAGHVAQVWLVCDGDKAAGGPDRARELSLCQRRQVLPSQPTEAWACHRPPLRCRGDLFSHTGDMALQQRARVGGCTWNAIVHYYLAMKPLPADAKYKTRRNRLHEHVLLSTVSRLLRTYIFIFRHDSILLTFLHGACRHGFAVGPLELIEVRPYFNLIDDAFLQTRQSYVPLRRDLQVLNLPGPWGGQPWRLPVQDAVALNKLGRILHLRGETERAGWGYALW